MEFFRLLQVKMFQRLRKHCDFEQCTTTIEEVKNIVKGAEVDDADEIDNTAIVNYVDDEKRIMYNVITLNDAAVVLKMTFKGK